jgi:hypothetical protein
MSTNLPSWAYNLGYRLEGDLGTIGDLYLYDVEGDPARTWYYPERSPNIFELEEIVKGLEWKRYGR